MNYEQFAILVKGMKAVYTNERFLPDEVSVRTWYDLLKDIPYKVLSVAIQKYMLTEKYPPTISELREKAVEVRSSEMKDWSEAFQEARRSISNYGMYRQEEALKSLSPLTRKVVEQLGFQELCTCENIDVYRGHFRMSYENLQRQEKQNAQLPDRVKKMIATMQTSNKMIEGVAVNG